MLILLFIYKRNLYVLSVATLNKESILLHEEIYLLVLWSS